MNFRILPFFLLVGAVTACGNSSTNMPPNNDAPGGSNSDAAATSDALVNDAGTDAAGDAAPPAPVSLIAVYNSQIVSGATVLFRDAAGSVIATKQTDATGAASERVPAGGSVSLFVGTAPPALLGGPNNVVFTFVSVQPGDELRIEDPRPAFGALASKTITVPNAAGATSYTIASRCMNTAFPATSTATISVGTAATCAQTDFFVEARNGQASLGSFFATNITTTGATIDVAASTYKASKPLSVTLSNVPATVTSVSATLRDNDGKIYMPAANAVASVTVTGSTGSATIAVPDIGTAMEARIQYFASGFQIVRKQTTIDNVAIDLAAESLPAIASAAVNVAAGTVTWTETGGARTPDAVRTFVNVNRAPFNFSHIVVAPHQNSSLQIPTFPAPFTAYNVKASDTASTSVFLYRFSGGYHSGLRYYTSNSILPAGTMLNVVGA